MSSLLTAEVLAALQPLYKGPALIITAGNTFRSDDGVGPYLARSLKDILAKRPGARQLSVIDAGQTPENIVDEAAALAPEYIVVIDAADFGGAPGEVRVIEEAAIPRTTLSTHMIPLNVVTGLISDQTGAKVVFIGIQIKSAALGEGLSPEVQSAATVLSQRLCATNHICPN